MAIWFAILHLNNCFNIVVLLVITGSALSIIFLTLGGAKRFYLVAKRP